LGTDNLHHRKREAKIAKARKPATINTIPYVLIVCEGKKTEPNYFKELVSHFKLPSVNVVIDGDCGSDPVSVVNHGIKLYNDQIKFNNRVFDKVYFVFDRDHYHLEEQGCKYQSALSTIKSKKQLKEILVPINSVPCFELWLLLHHIETTKPYHGIPNISSAGDEVKNELKKYWPDYDKGALGIFGLALAIDGDNMKTAINRADRVLRAAIECNDENPSTYVHKLVEQLLEMRHKNRGSLNSQRLKPI